MNTSCNLRQYSLSVGLSSSWYMDRIDGLYLFMLALYSSVGAVKVKKYILF